jgi:hypothetical protein
VESDVDDVPLGVVNVGASRADPQPGDDAGCLCCDLMVHGASPDLPGHTSPGNAVPAPRLPGAAGPAVAGLLLPGSPGLPSPHVKWGKVEDRVKQACS